MPKQLEIVRVKRKRDHDPLQLLVLENSDTFKRSKKNSFYFKFARTETEEIASGQPILTIDESRNLKLVNDIPAQEAPVTSQSVEVDTQDGGDRELSDDIKQMIQEQGATNITTSQQSHKKPIRRKHQRAEPIESYNSNNDFVYDIYFRDTEIDDESKLEQLRIAYFTYDEDMFNFVDEKIPDSDEDLLNEDIDEDSNAEDHYQNDYPDDEDQDNNDSLDLDDKAQVTDYLDQTTDMVMSDDEDDQRQILREKARFNKDILDDEDSDDVMEMSTQDPLQRGFENLYRDYFGSDDENYEGPTSFLDDGRLDDDSEFPKRNYYEDEEDEDLQAHRDRIFGKLEKMINERS